MNARLFIQPGYAAPRGGRIDACTASAGPWAGDGGRVASGAWEGRSP